MARQATVSAVVWTPWDRQLLRRTIPNTLQALQDLVGGHLEGIYPQELDIPGLAGYVNEEFLYTHPEWRQWPWAWDDYEFLRGPAVWTGVDGRGETVDCPCGPEIIGSVLRVARQHA